MNLFIRVFSSPPPPFPHLSLSKSLTQRLQRPTHPPQTVIYPIAFRKLASLIEALRLFRIAFVSSSRASAARTAPASEPSPAGKSIVCSYMAIFGAIISGFMACSLRRRFAARRRCFFDFAVYHVVSMVLYFSPAAAASLKTAFKHKKNGDI